VTDPGMSSETVRRTRSWTSTLWSAVMGLVFLGKRSQAQKHRGEALKIYAAGNAPKAIEHLSKAIRWVPDDPDLHCDLGQIYFEIGSYGAAQSQFSTALSYKYDHKRALKGLGFSLQQLGKYSEAVYVYLRYMRENTQDSDVLINLGAALHDLGKYEDALRYYAMARSYDPTNSTIRENSGRSFYAMGKIDDAIGSLRDALALDRNNVEAYKLLGLCLESKGERDEALLNYRQALEHDSADGELHLRVCQLLQRMGRYDEALREASQALGIFEAAADRAGLADAYWELGWIYYQRSDFDNSVHASQKAIELSPELYQARFNLALVLIHQERLEEGLRQYEIGAKGLTASELRYWAVDDVEEALQKHPELNAVREALRVLKNKCEILAKDSPEATIGEEKPT